jgi:hypothetical protein
MLGKNLLEPEGLNNRTMYLNTVINSFIGYKTKKMMEIFKHFQFI